MTQCAALFISIALVFAAVPASLGLWSVCSRLVSRLHHPRLREVTPKFALAGVAVAVVMSLYTINHDAIPCGSAQVTLTPLVHMAAICPFVRAKP